MENVVDVPSSPLKWLILLLGCWFAWACDDPPVRDDGPVEEVDPFCRCTVRVDRVLNRLDSVRYAQNVARISGAVPVHVGDEEVVIQNRRTTLMSLGDPTARGFEWLLQELRRYHPEERIRLHPFEVVIRDQTYQPFNLALEIPGEVNPDRWIILVAHFDTNGASADGLTAPGANDNATGSAALLEAAIALSGERMAKSVRLLWTTAEEAGLLGSAAWVRDHPDEDIEFVVNLDMIGLPPPSGNVHMYLCYMGGMTQELSLGLIKLEYCGERILAEQSQVTRGVHSVFDCMSRSDHLPFANSGALAVMAIGDLDEMITHTLSDTSDRLDYDFAFSVVQMTVGMALALAELPLALSAYPVPVRVKRR